MVNLVNCSSRVSAVSWLTMIFMTVFVLLAHQVSLGQSAAAPNGQYLDEENINQNKQLVLGEFSHSHLFLNTFDRIRNKNGTRYAALGAFLIRKRDPMMMTAVCLLFICWSNRDRELDWGLCCRRVAVEMRSSQPTNPPLFFFPIFIRCRLLLT